MTTFTYNLKATYSAEDNKIRIYPQTEERLSDEDYQQFKAAGYRWAPHQKLFFVHWSPKAEDLAAKFCGEIEAEEVSLAERAELKAKRLERLAEKRYEEATGYAKAAQNFAQNSSQPILGGHHSQRKAEKAAERAALAEKNADKSFKLANYWLDRAHGAIIHANFKADIGATERRIKTLLEDLRAHQRRQNDANFCLEYTLKTEEFRNADPERFNKRVMTLINSQYSPRFGLWAAVTDGKMTHEAAQDELLQTFTKSANNSYRRRYIEHTLNRLAYEQAQLWEVPLYTGALKDTLLQTFARTHGAEKPKATKTADGYKLESPVDLPLHIGTGKSIELTNDEWRELMQSVGYEVPAPKPKAPSILNLDVEYLDLQGYRGAVERLRVLPMTKERYAKVPKDERGTRLSACGGFKVKVCKDFTQTDRQYFMRDSVAVFLTDSKSHPWPESIIEKTYIVKKVPSNA